MSSGLRSRAPMDPDYDPAGPYPDHLYLYTGPINAFHYAATRPLQWPPGTVGRYRNIDVAVTNYLVRLALEQRGEEYWSFPRRALFDPLGIRTMVMDTDAHGNFLTQGYELASARDWARLGNLYLHDGVWNGRRILPEGYAAFVSTLAPAWAADRRPVYGGFFWINGDGRFPVPADAYFMAGAGGQFTLIIPSHDLVVARLGHFSGVTVASQSLCDRARPAPAGGAEAEPEPAMSDETPLGVQIGRLASRRSRPPGAHLRIRHALARRAGGAHQPSGPRLRQPRRDARFLRHHRPAERHRVLRGHGGGLEAGRDAAADLVPTAGHRAQRDHRPRGLLARRGRRSARRRRAAPPCRSAFSRIARCRPIRCRR